VTNSELVKTRYGQSPDRTKTIWVLAVMGLVAVIGFAAWVAFSQERLSFEDVGFSVKDQWHTEVTFDVNKDAGETVFCNVQALNQQYGIVGWREIQVPVDRSSVRITTTINTTEEAVTALVHGCEIR
jgi:ABC-type transporter Mla subunit MlaD